MRHKGFFVRFAVSLSVAAVFALSAPARAGDPPVSPQAPAARPDNTIRLVNGDLGPVFPGAESQRAALCTADPLPQTGRVHLLVQLDHIPTAAEKEEWAWRDMRLEAYLPNFAWMVSVPASKAEALPGTPGVRFVKRWLPADKVATPLAAGTVGPWARDEASGLVHVLLFLHRDTRMEAGRDLVEGVGGLAVHAFEDDRAWACWVRPETLGSLAGSEGVYWIEEYPPPLDPMNNHARADLNVNAVAAAPYSLTGSGVNVFVFDGGRARTTHEKLTGHITSVDAASGADHSTHVACTVAGSSGAGQANATGMAPGAWLLTAGFTPGSGVLFYDSYGDLLTDYSAARNDGTHPADMATNSLGSNVAQNGYACTYEGKYGQSSRMIDRIVRGDESGIAGTYKRYVVTWAAGNERQGGSPWGRCGGAYNTLPPPASAKNPITVGAVNADYDGMADFSSWGPTEVGRLKPVVVGPGCETSDYHVAGQVGLYSALNTSDTAYGVMCGTSMATPAVAGAIALLLQRYHQIRSTTEEPWNALVKALLIQTAKDLGPVGPDYSYGYGKVDIKAAIDLMNTHNSRDASAYYHDVLTDSPSGVSQGDDHTWTVAIPADTKEFKVSLAWDDYFSEAGTTGALVNNLDLELRSPSNTAYYPWIMTPASPWLPATTGVNNLDNQEQVVISNPAAGTWTIHVKGTLVPQGPQSFGLAYTYTANPHWVCTIPVDYSPAARNGGFESAPAAGDWTLANSAARDNTQFHSGAYSLKLAGANSANDYAYQYITIPADATRANVSYWWRCQTTENWSGSDFHFVAVYASDGSTWLGFVDIYHNGVMMNNSGGFYTSRWLLQDNIDLLPWKGQSIFLLFQGTCDSYTPATTYWVDDVRVEICTPFACTSPGSPSITGITDEQTCVQNGIRVNYTSGTGATRHDLYRDAALAVTGYATGALYNPGDASSHTYTVRAVNTVATCYTESAGSAFADAVCAAPGEVDPGSTSGTAQYWSADKTTHQWHTVAGTVDGYRLLRGVLADLPNLIGGGTDSCTRYQGTGTSQNVSTDSPASVAGRFYWYLVDAYNGAGSGPAGNATAGARTINTTGACP